MELQHLLATGQVKSSGSRRKRDPKHYEDAVSSVPKKPRNSSEGPSGRKDPPPQSFFVVEVSPRRRGLEGHDGKEIAMKKKGDSRAALPVARTLLSHSPPRDGKIREEIRFSST